MYPIDFSHWVINPLSYHLQKNQPSPKGSRNLNPIDASNKNRSKKTSHVSYYTASQSYKHRTSINWILVAFVVIVESSNVLYSSPSGNKNILLSDYVLNLEKREGISIKRTDRWDWKTPPPLKEKRQIDSSTQSTTSDVVGKRLISYRPRLIQHHLTCSFTFNNPKFNRI